MQQRRLGLWRHGRTDTRAVLLAQGRCCFWAWKTCVFLWLILGPWQYKIPRRRNNHREFKREYRHDREEPKQGEGNERSHAVSQTVCPGWQQASWWRVDKVGTVRTYGGPGGEGLAAGAKTGEGAVPLRKTCLYEDSWPSLQGYQWGNLSRNLWEDQDSGVANRGNFSLPLKVPLSAPLLFFAGGCLGWSRAERPSVSWTKMLETLCLQQQKEMLNIKCVQKHAKGHRYQQVSNTEKKAESQRAQRRGLRWNPKESTYARVGRCNQGRGLWWNPKEAPVPEPEVRVRDRKGQRFKQVMKVGGH